MWKSIVVLVSVVVVVRAYSSGAPKDACEDMIPQHHTPPQKTSSPYRVQASFDKGNGLVRINIKGPEPFKGFFVQGRVGDSPVGAFVNPPKTTKLVDCGTGKSNAATHADSKVKNEVNLLWRPPPRLREQVVFRATVAKDGGTFWVGTVSNKVQIN